MIPESTTIAVPCWSSWKTGISNSFFKRSSISKQRGAEISSKLIYKYDNNGLLTDISSYNKEGNISINIKVV